MCMLRKVEEVWKKNSLYDEQKRELDMHTAVDLVMCLGDFNGHGGGHIDGFYGVHGGYGVGQRYFGRENIIKGIMCVKYMV